MIHVWVTYNLDQVRLLWGISTLVIVLTSKHFHYLQTERYILEPGSPGDQQMYFLGFLEFLVQPEVKEEEESDVPAHKNAYAIKPFFVGEGPLFALARRNLFSRTFFLREKP